MLENRLKKRCCYVLIRSATTRLSYFHTIFSVVQSRQPYFRIDFCWSDLPTQSMSSLRGRFCDLPSWSIVWLSLSLYSSSVEADGVSSSLSTSFPLSVWERAREIQRNEPHVFEREWKKEDRKRWKRGKSLRWSHYNFFRTSPSSLLFRLVVSYSHQIFAH